MPDETRPSAAEQVERPPVTSPEGTAITPERHQAILAEVGFTPPEQQESPIARGIRVAFEMSDAAKLGFEDLIRSGVVKDKSSEDQSQERHPEDVKQVVIRKASERKPGDPPANFRIKEDGTIEMLNDPELRSPGDPTTGEVIIEVDDSAGSAARAASEAQKASARQMVDYLLARYAEAKMAPEIPGDLYAALYQEPLIPPPQVIERSPGYNGNRISPRPVTSIPAAPAGGFPPASVGRSPRTEGVESRAFDNMRPSPNIPDRTAMGSFVDRVVAAVSRNEGSFTSINWNDNGAGISVGKAQWNQKAGELPSFLQRLHEADPGRFNQIFGPHAQNMLNENFVRNAHITKGSDLGNRMAEALSEPKFQEVQTEMLREKVIKAVELSSKYGHTSELFVAQVADMANQFGWGGVESCLRKSNVANIQNEDSAISALTQAGQQRWAGRAGRDRLLAQTFSSHKDATDVNV